MPNTYKARKVYTQSSIYDSKAEYRVQQLSRELKHHPEKRVKYVIEHTYKPDFEAPDGSFIEVKGYMPAEDRAKYKALKLQNPDLKLVFVFTDPKEVISSASRTTYAQWATKLGFTWHHIDSFDPSLYGCT